MPVVIARVVSELFAQNCYVVRAEASTAVGRGEPHVVGGDTLFAGGVGRTDFPGGSHEQLVSGIRAKLYTLSDATAVHPGHGPATTVGRERRSNLFV